MASLPDSSRRRRLLVVDDDGHIREVLRYALDQAGYSVTEAGDGRTAWDQFQQSLEPGGRPVDLVVLDILMPGMDGLDLCRRIRQRSTVPVLFLSSKDEELDRILGLELGADDYVTKPFSPRELVARVRAALRRSEEIEEARRAGQATPPDLGEDSHPSPGSRTPNRQLRCGRLCIDLARHECRVDETPVVLTVSEFGLLSALLRHPGHVLSRQQMVSAAYGADHYLSDRTVDSHLRRIRKKLAAEKLDCIETVYGVGYRLSEDA